MTVPDGGGQDQEQDQDQDKSQTPGVIWVENIVHVSSQLNVTLKNLRLQM